MIGAVVHLVLLLGPLALTGRLGAIQGGLALVWVVGSAVEQRCSPDEDEIPPFERYRAVGLLLMVWICLFTAVPSWMGMGGACLFVSGLTLRMWAIGTLGTGFGAGFEPTVALIDTGPYRFLKHPSEWGLQAMGWGLAIASASLSAAVAAFLLLSLPSFVRMRLEDAHLTP